MENVKISIEKISKTNEENSNEKYHHLVSIPPQMWKRNFITFKYKYNPNGFLFNKYNEGDDIQ